MPRPASASLALHGAFLTRPRELGGLRTPCACRGTLSSPWEALNELAAPNSPLSVNRFIAAGCLASTEGFRLPSSLGGGLAVAVSATLKIRLRFQKQRQVKKARICSHSLTE